MRYKIGDRVLLAEDIWEYSYFIYGADGGSNQDQEVTIPKGTKGVVKNVIMDRYGSGEIEYVVELAFREDFYYIPVTLTLLEKDIELNFEYHRDKKLIEIGI